MIHDRVTEITLIYSYIGLKEGYSKQIILVVFIARMLL
jgi:hypothetical protein